MLFALVSSLAVLAVPVAGTHGVDSNALHIFMVAEDASYAPRFFRAPLAQKISFTGVGMSATDSASATAWRNATTTDRGYSPVIKKMARGCSVWRSTVHSCPQYVYVPRGGVSTRERRMRAV